MTNTLLKPLEQPLERPKDSPKKQPQDPLKHHKRLAKATTFVLLGVTAVAAGIAVTGYRLSHLVVDNGSINSRIVRLKSPIDGKVTDFYAEPGVRVRSQQVLARIERSQDEERTLLQLQEEVATDSAQLTAAQNTLASLQEQIQLLDANQQALQAVDTTLAEDTVSQHQATLDGAIVRANAAKADYDRYRQALDSGVDRQFAAHTVEGDRAEVDRVVAVADAAKADYERHRSLLKAGAVSERQVDQLYAAWQAAEAGVRQAEANLDSAKTALSSTQQGVAVRHPDLPQVVSEAEVAQLKAVWEAAEADVVRARAALEEARSAFEASSASITTHHQQTHGANLLNRQLNLTQTIEEQKALVSNLQAQLDSSQAQLQQARSFYSDAEDLEIAAPLTGVVYRTDREGGEQIDRSDELLSLIDCNDLWVETIVTAQQASGIAAQKPVRVEIAGYGNALTGQVDLIQPVSSIQSIDERTRMVQVQALMPPIPPNFVGEPLTRVTVRIAPPPNATESWQFCGVGQNTRLTFQKTLPFSGK